MALALNLAALPSDRAQESGRSLRSPALPSSPALVSQAEPRPNDPEFLPQVPTVEPAPTPTPTPPDATTEPDEPGQPIPVNPPIRVEPLPPAAPAPEPDPTDPIDPPLIPTEEPGQILIIPTPEDVPEPPSEDAEEIDGTPEEGIEPGVPLPDGTIPLSVEAGNIVELTADRQEYDTIERVFWAEGNAVMRFRGGILAADRLQVNLPNRTAVAEGNVVLTRGEQVIRGDRFVYNFVQEEGRLLNARGEVFIPAADTDLGPTLPTDVTAGVLTEIPLSEQILAGQPLTGVTAAGSLQVTVGGGGATPGQQSSFGTSGQVNRLRFEAEEIDLMGDNWVATNVRLTNDPFSPPDLEVRSRRVTFTRESPTRSVIRARNPRAVFDGGLEIPLLRDRIVIDERDRDPGLFQLGFDERELGGLYIERSFEIVSTPWLRFSVTPQLLVQRSIDDGNFFAASSYGLRNNLDVRFDTLTTLQGNAVFTSLDLDEVEENFRASVRLQRGILTPIGRHTLALEYSYRDRLFNGSLGFQNVQRSVGFVLSSPSILLGESGIGLSYQVGAQYINANTDQIDLLEPVRENNRVDLGRFQTSVALSRGFPLWTGEPLPATPDAGLRYTPVPVVPYLQLVTGVRGTYSYYTSGDTQAVLTGSIGLRGQFGHFSRDFFDYTAFNVTYSQSLRESESPFLFDRAEDRQVLSAGIVQQIYGPVRFGVQTAYSFDNNEEIDTIFTLEYSRRAYSLTLSFSPVREAGALTFRVNDFNWTGTPEPFSGLDNR